MVNREGERTRKKRLDIGKKRKKRNSKSEELIGNMHGCARLQLSCQAPISDHTAVMTALTKWDFHEGS